MLELQSTEQSADNASNTWLLDDVTRNLLATWHKQTAGIWSWDFPTSSSVIYYQIPTRGLSATEPSEFILGTAERAWEVDQLMVIYRRHQYLKHDISTYTTRGREQLKKYAEIGALEREYHYVSGVVQQYILRNQRLIEPLVEIRNRLEKYFGEDVNLYLEYLEDPEEGFESLYVSILCHSEPEEAMKLLTRFYHDWWLDVDFEIRRYIAFTLKRARRGFGW